jgi:hypothetical protein
MPQTQVLWPVVAQVALTFIVWIWLYVTRIGEMIRKGIKSQDLADGDRRDKLLKNVVNPSDNFENLFEVPVLFFAAMLAVHSAGLGDDVYAFLGWAFVVLRAAHSLIHCTYNRVLHRFVAYALSTIIVWVIWGKFAYQLAG